MAAHCRKLARSASPPERRAAGAAAKRRKLQPAADEDDDEVFYDATDDDMPLSMLAAARPDEPPERGRGPTQGPGLQAKGTSQGKPTGRPPAQGLGRGTAMKPGGGGAGRALSNVGRALGNDKGKEPRKPGPAAAEPSKDRKKGPSEGSEAKATGVLASLLGTARR